MSEPMALSTDEIQIYVPLLNEGTDVLRPTIGVIVEPDVVRVRATRDYDPDVEQWAFIPGSTVRCVKEDHEGRDILVARHRVAS